MFFETVSDIDEIPHMIIEGVCVKSQEIEELKSLFVNELNNIESDWTVHKKIIRIKGTLRQQIPKSL